MASDLDPVMRKVVELFRKSGKTLDELGREMGYSAAVARKAAWQFLEKTSDPHVSVLRRFAKAMEAPIQDFFLEGEIMMTGRDEKCGEVTVSMGLDIGLLPDEQRKIRPLDNDVATALIDAGINERFFWTSNTDGEGRTVVLVTKTKTLLEFHADKFARMKKNEILQRLRRSLSELGR